jgi:tetratricopeptide (TPR) repeat protein
MVMESDAAVGLLLDRTQLSLTSEIHIEARKIVTELGFLPLAIEQAAAYIRISQNIQEYLETYAKQRHQLLNWRPDGNHSYNYTVGTVWKMALERLRVTCPTSIVLVQFLVFQNPDEILLDFLKAGAAGVHLELQQIIENNLLLRECLTALEGYSLVRVSEGQKIRIHRLVQAVIQDDMQSQLRVQVVSEVLRLGLRSFPNMMSDRSQRGTCRRYRAQVVSCLENCHIAKSQSEWLALTDLLADYLSQDGFYADALKWSILTSEFRKETLGSEHPDTLTSMSNLAASYRELGRSKEAAQLDEQTLGIRKRVLGLEHPGTLISMNNLAASYRHLGMIKEAAHLYEETMELDNRIFGPEHPHIFYRQEGLARSLRMLGRVNEAIEWHEKVLELRKRLLGPNHPETLYSMDGLALSLHCSGQNNQAVQLHEETLKLRKSVLPPEHPDIFDSMEGLADTLCSLGQDQAGLQLYEETLSGRTRILGENHPDTLRVIESSINLRTKMEMSEQGYPVHVAAY